MRFSCRFTPNLNIFWLNMSNSPIYLPNVLTFLLKYKIKIVLAFGVTEAEKFFEMVFGRAE